MEKRIGMHPHKQDETSLPSRRRSTVQAGPPHTLQPVLQRERKQQQRTQGVALSHSML